MNEPVVYLLASEVSNKTYIGYTNNIFQRIRRHNGIISGGAKYTTRDRPWKLVLYVSGFKDKRDALSFEWYAKHKKSEKTGKYRVCQKLEPRIQNIENLVEEKEYLQINY